MAGRVLFPNLAPQAPPPSGMTLIGMDASSNGYLQNALGGVLHLLVPSTGTATLSIATGKTFTALASIGLDGTDGAVLNVGTGGTLGSAAFTAASAYATALHAAQHGVAGGDPITIAESQVTNLVADLADKATLADAKTIRVRTYMGVY